MELSGIIIGTEIEDDYLILQVYEGEYDYICDEEEEENDCCANIKILMTSDFINDYKLKIENLRKIEENVEINIDNNNLSIKNWNRDEIQIQLKEAPIIIYKMNFKFIKPELFIRYYYIS